MSDKPDVNLTLTHMEFQVLLQVTEDLLQWMIGDGEMSEAEDDALHSIIQKIRTLETSLEGQ